MLIQHVSEGASISIRALHRTAIPLLSIATGELGPYAIHAGGCVPIGNESILDGRYNHGYTLQEMKTAISIPDSLFSAADQLAQRMGVSRSELYQRAVEAYLKRHQQRSVTEALNEFYGLDSNQGKLDVALDLMQASSLSQEKW